MSNRGPIIHGVLLVVALLFAYQTWTREETPDRNVGEVAVWSMSVDSITSITYETTDRKVQIDRKQDGKKSYFWGTDTRTIKKPVKKPPPPQKKPEPPEPDPAAAGDAGVSEAAPPPPPEPPPEPEPEIEIKTREFAVGEQGQEVIENLADLKALRNLGVIDDERKKEYELIESTDNVTVTAGSTSRSLIVGGKVPGSGGGRYVLEPDSNRAYALAGAVLNNLLTGESGMRLRKPHLFDSRKDPGKATISAGGKTRSLVKVTIEEESGKKNDTWVDAATPDKQDQTMSNFLENVAKLNPSEYESDIDPSSLELLVKVTYQKEDGEELGWIELYEQAPEPEPEPAPTPPPTPTPAPAGAEGAGATPAGETPATPASPDAAKPDAAKPDAASPDAANPDPAKPGDGHGPDDGHGHGAEEKPDPAKKPEKKPEYFIRSESTWSYASTSLSIATRIKEDIQQILAE